LTLQSWHQGHQHTCHTAACGTVADDHLLKISLTGLGLQQF
jgi:phosphoenolpyruvate-protein kinase (PTS system EI component)